MFELLEHLMTLISRRMFTFICYSVSRYLVPEFVCQWYCQLSTSKLPPNSFSRTSDRFQDLPAGFRPVHVNWKDLDRCNVCHMDEV